MYAKVTIAYDGNPFYGFQKQVGSIYTVAGCIEEALLKLFKQPVTVIGAGRTDRGVHATGQVIGFELPFSIEANALKKALGSLLPESISIVNVCYQLKRFHAIQDATAREYHYCLSSNEDVPIYLKPYVVCVPGIDIEALNKSLSLFCGEHNFAAFCSHRKEMFDTRCLLYDVSIKATTQLILPFDHKENYIYAVRFLGRSFLYKMIRHLVGASLASLQYKLSHKDIKTMLETGKRIKNWSVAPAKGLFLTAVHYET